MKCQLKIFCTRKNCVHHMSFGMPYTAVHLDITIVMFTFYILENRIALGVLINLGVHLCMWCTTKVNVEIEL